MKFIAQELREYMAALGVRTVDELVGRTDLFEEKEHLTERQEEVDLTQILSNPYEGSKQKVTFDPRQVYDFQLEKTLDEKVLLKQLGKKPSMRDRSAVSKWMSATQTVPFGTILLEVRSPENWAMTWKKIPIMYCVKVPADSPSEPLSPRA